MPKTKPLTLDGNHFLFLQWLKGQRGHRAHLLLSPPPRCLGSQEEINAIVADLLGYGLIDFEFIQPGNPLHFYRLNEAGLDWMDRVFRARRGENAGKSVDPTAYVLVSKVWPEKFTDYKRFLAFLNKHPEIRQRRAGPRRREIHVGDWLSYWDRQDKERFDADTDVVDSELNLDPTAVAGDFEGGARRRLDALRQQKDGK